MTSPLASHERNQILVYPYIYAELLDGSQGPSRVRIKNKTFQYWSRFSQASYRFSEVVTDDVFKKYIGEAI